MQLKLQIPAAFGTIMEGIILLTVLAGQFFLTYKLVRKPRQE
jgi:simple sugar transport system permease protein